MNTLIPKNKHALIKITKLVLGIDCEIDQHHVDQLKTRMIKHLKSGMSPRDIKEYYQISYSDFGMFLKSSLSLTLLPTGDAVRNFFAKSGKNITDKKRIYYKECEFKFDPYSFTEVPGYNLLLERGLFHPTKNPDGVCRDHMFSKHDGWINKISSELISHPCNCQYLSNPDNVRKSGSSCITLPELENRVSSNIFLSVSNEYKTLQKSELHKAKISATNSKYMTITNGAHNKRILKHTEIPVGYRQGMTRRNKLVVQPGLEPGNEIF